MKTRALTLVVCLIAAACGGGSGSPTAPAAPQPYTQNVTGTVSSLGTTFHNLTAPRAGNMTLSLTWSGGADLDLYLTPTSCANVYPIGSCQMLAISDKGGATPESIARTVASNETFKVWVDNFANSAQNYTLSIRIE